MASSWRNIQDEDDDEEEEFRPEVCAPSTLTSNPRGGSENRRISTRTTRAPEEGCQPSSLRRPTTAG